MAVLVNGELLNHWHDTDKHNGAFVRESSLIRDTIGANKSTEFSVEPHRYCLYAAHDSWSHRAVVTRAIKQLEESVELCYVDPDITESGWRLQPGDDFHYLYELYLATSPDYTGRISLPLLWDRKTKRIVNNESSDIMRMLGCEFDALAGNQSPFRPSSLNDEIDAMNVFVYENINNGVYKVGFATAQWAYNEALEQLFDALDKLEKRLSNKRYLIGEYPVETDWRLFVSLVRFDAIYYYGLRCNKRRLQDYLNLWNYTRELYQMPHIATTVDMGLIRKSYYQLLPINPSGIIPGDPMIEFDTPTLTVRYQTYSAPLQ